MTKAWNDLYNFDHDWTHFIVTSRHHLVGDIYIGGRKVVKEEYKETRQQLVNRINDLTTLKGMHLHEDWKKKNALL